MTILITGVGLVGSHVAQNLVSRGEKPVLMDVAPQEDALGEVVGLDKVTLLKGSVLRPFDLTGAIREHDVTHIIHTVANPMLTLGAQHDPLPAIELNIMGTVNVLEAARVHKLDRVVASSGNIVAYHVAGGEGNGNPAVEEAFPRPVTFYSATKQAVENIGLNYTRWHNVGFAAVRYAVVAGPWGGQGGGGPSLAFRDAVTQAVRGEEVVVPAIGFEWVYAKDAAEGTVLAALTPDISSQVFNITMGCQVSPQEFAEAISEVFPKATVRIAEPAEGPSVIPDTHLASDISLAREVLGYTPKFGMVDAVREMAAWLESRESKFV